MHSRICCIDKQVKLAARSLLKGPFPLPTAALSDPILEDRHFQRSLYPHTNHIIPSSFLPRSQSQSFQNICALVVDCRLVRNNSLSVAVSVVRVSSPHRSLLVTCLLERSNLSRSPNSPCQSATRNKPNHRLSTFFGAAALPQIIPAPPPSRPLTILRDSIHSVYLLIIRSAFARASSCCALRYRHLLTPSYQARNRRYLLSIDFSSSR